MGPSPALTAPSAAAAAADTLNPPASCTQVLVAHNGPAGLGGRRHSICGVDWVEPEADHGDPDLQARGCEVVQ